MTKNRDLKISITAVFLPLMLIFAVFTALSCDLFNDDLNDTALKSAIAEAKSLLANTKTSDLNGSDVSSGEYWATSPNIATLQGAVTAAEGVLDTAETQVALGAATTTLRAAIDTFKGQRQQKKSPQGGDPNENTGNIRGTIKLTNIPATNRPTVFIGAAIDGNELSYESDLTEISLSGVPSNQTEATVNWSIPVYENEEIPDYAFFSLYITPDGTTSSLRIYLMNLDYESMIEIPEDYDVGFLGTYSIGTVELSGTITVDIGGTPVPRVKIRAHIYYEEPDIGYTELTYPGADAPWTIVILSPEDQQSIKFSVAGAGTNSDWSTLFWEQYEPEPKIFPQSNDIISGININLGTISRGNIIGELLGTITLTDIKNQKQTVYINAGLMASEIDLSAVTGTQAELNWSIPVYEDDYYEFMGRIKIEVFESGSNECFEIVLGVHDFIFDEPIDLGTVTLWNPNVPRNLKSLTANTWVNGDIAYSYMDWYTISVIPGTYNLWWNDAYEGDDSKTADIVVHVFRGTPENLTLINYVNHWENDDDAWYSPSSFTVNFTGTVYVRVDPYYTEGTYGIVYSTADTRPSL
ncbi:MAG: hypothetical protein FWB73_05610 [Treponema sp.]|nr:hypothetical protein [Treponema sp.]